MAPGAAGDSQGGASPSCALLWAQGSAWGSVHATGLGKALPAGLALSAQGAEPGPARGVQAAFWVPQELPCPAPGTDGLYTENLGKKLPTALLQQSQGGKTPKTFPGAEIPRAVRAAGQKGVLSFWEC